MAKEQPDQHTTEQIHALLEISEAVTSERYIDDVLKLILTVAANVAGAKICSLLLLAEKSGELKLRATQSMDDVYTRKPNLRLGEGVAGRVAESGEPKIVEDVKKEPFYINREIARRAGLCSLLCLPLRVKGRVIGVLNCYTEELHHFSSTEVDVLTAVANQAAVAIENTELLVRTRVIEAELEARKMIERAKDVLMKQTGLDGEAAYERMQKQSMNSRKSMREVAEAILLANELAGGM